MRYAAAIPWTPETPRTVFGVWALMSAPEIRRWLMGKLTTTAAGDFETFTTRDVAKLLKIHEATVRELVHAGRLAAFRIGPALRIERGALLAFVKAARSSKPAPCRDPRRGRGKPR
jgi:excisionase family DNA binding protein